MAFNEVYEKEHRKCLDCEQELNKEEAGREQCFDCYSHEQG